MKYIATCLSLIILLCFLRVERWHVRANEYFADGTMITVSLRESGKFIGVIRAWGWYVIYGKRENCRIEPIFSPVADARTIRCQMRMNDKHLKFSGWIDFRGHPRPFCGARHWLDLPDKCFED